MKRAIVFLALGVCACSGGAPADGALPQMTELFGELDAYDAISVQNGLVSVEIPGSGVVTCSVNGCDSPTLLVASDAYVTGALASSVTYAAQDGTDDGVSGELHVVDASGDHAIATGLAYPSWVATSGARTFVADDSFSYDDTPATIACVGCTSDGQAAPWISGLGGSTYGMFADATNVYVLADDPTLSTVQLLACSASHPCWGEPRIVLDGLDQTITAQQIASDGDAVYVARAVTSDVVRVDASGVTPILPTTNASALVWDASMHVLWFGTPNGDVGYANADGTANTLIASAAGSIRAIATDDSSVYVVTGASGEIVMKTQKQ
ncbi:MAG TPA: hypothetical protein VGH87_18810 [Polyangiaceae bacterium]